MKYDIYKRSRSARTLWLGFVVFFMIFGSCPVKRLIKLELYRHSAPIECPYDGMVISKQIRDGNMLNKDGKAKMAITYDLHDAAGDGNAPELAAFLLPLLFIDELFYFLLGKRLSTRRVIALRPALANDGPTPLYLRCRSLRI